jgi:hypothetical protein
MAENWQLKAVLSANAAGMLKTLDAVNKATRSTRKHLADVGSGSVKLAQSLALPVGLLGGLAAGFSLAGVVSAAKNFAVLGDEVAKGSQRIGVSIADYQQLNYVAGQSGVSAEELGSSMGRLNKGIAQAAAGKNKDLASLFAKAGISMRDANGQLRSGADLLPEVADLFARNGNAATQARMGNAIYGKSWQALAPLLQGGSEGIKELQERYKKLGLGISDSAIKEGEKFGDQLADLAWATKSYGNVIMSKLLPSLGPLIEKTIWWAVANREVITTRITEFITEFSNSMAKIDWAAVVEGVGSFFNGLKSLVDWLGGARNALIALVVFMNASGILAFASLMGSVFKLGGSLWALAFTQIPAAIAGMGGLEKAMGKAAFGAGKLLGIMGQIGLVAGAGWAGWEAGKLLNEYVINPATQLVTGDKNATLGTALYDAFNPDPMAQMNAPTKPSLVGSPSKGRVDGQVNIKIDGLPPGSRVDQLGSGNMPINLDMGVRSFATGMPY